jgi:ABC-type Na+ transport system ATPase subunit NatA
LVFAIEQFLMCCRHPLIHFSELLYCGNNNSLTANGFPNFNTSDPSIYGFDIKAKSLNFISYADLAGVNPGSFLGAANPCVFWFGQDYPRFSEIYEKNANLTGFQKLDSTFVPPPNGGWAGLLAKGANLTSVDQRDISQLSRLQLAHWGIVGSKPELKDILGAKPQINPLSIQSALQTSLLTFRNASSFPVLRTPAPNGTFAGAYGILGSVETRYFINTSVPITGPDSAFLQPVPYYLPGDYQSDEDLDKALADKIRDTINALAALNKTVLTNPNRNQADLLRFYQDAGKISSQMPYGALFLDDFNAEELYSRVVLHFGSDRRISAAANFPTQGKRQLLQLTQWDQSLLRSFSALSSNPNTTIARSTLTQGVRVFPEQVNTTLDFGFGAVIGQILFPFGVSFLLPIFVITLVKEKEDRIFMMMKMNGMNGLSYYSSHYITFYVLYLISTIIFVASGFYSRIQFFTLTSPWVLFILFFIWGHVQIALAFFFASLFNRSRIALVIVFLIVLCGVIISLSLASLYRASQVAAPLLLWPPFAFYRALSLISRASFSRALKPYSLADLQPGNEVLNCIFFMCGGILVYGALSIYLNAVLPSEFGVRKPWHFPLTDPYKSFQKSQRKKSNNGVDPKSESELAASIQIDESELKFEDADVKSERSRVLAGDFPASSPVVMSHMRKIYKGRSGLGPKLAVKDVTFHAESGTIFGLLGPNGAGKTTLISILTGLYESSSGLAMLAGYQVGEEDMDSVYKVIGVCPQFDILWEDLTVGEHLYFYARLKGVGVTEERAAVEAALAKVSLTTLEHRPTKRLSGGEKRRLSIAIALVGEPSVVFLDEPTTGEYDEHMINVYTFIISCIHNSICIWDETD